VGICKQDREAELLYFGWLIAADSPTEESASSTPRKTSRRNGPHLHINENKNKLKLIGFLRRNNYSQTSTTTE